MNHSYPIEPTLKTISDPIVIAQAWKKASRYIRYSNWYSDTIELDLSTIKLNSLIDTWQKEIQSNNNNNEKARVVWAPKNQDWAYGDNYWGPEKIEEKQKLRPLAHISIKEQVISTAIMISLANIVETYQGDPTFPDEKESQCLSFGNRLDCEWKKNDGKSTATFKWGNANIYRKYFLDYKTFLNRPIKVIEKLMKNLPKDKDLYLVSLDLKSFYTNISINGLINSIKIVMNESNLNEKVDEEFYNLLKKRLTWQWSEKDKADYKQLDLLHSVGLPQGLVASGFLSNAYLAPFDKKFGEIIKGRKSCENDIYIKDYSRYVDDIRLVIEVPKAKDKKATLDSIQKFMSNQLNIYLDTDLCISEDENRLDFNTEKNEIYTYNEISTESTMSATLHHIQKNMSGPFNFDILQQTTADLMRVFDNTYHKLDMPKVNNPYKLEKIYENRADVRDDTVKRFVSGRLLKNLESKRLMASSENDVNETSHLTEKHFNLSEADLLNNDYEKAAKMLLNGWTHNISLTLLLKHSLQINTDRSIIQKLFHDLKYKFRDTIKNGEKEQELAIYFVFAELYKHAATYLGYYGEKSVSDYKSLHTELKKLSKLLLKPKSPWYLKQQIALFFFSIEDFNNGLYSIPELKNYKNVQQLGKKTWLSSKNNKKATKDNLTYAILLTQISWKDESFIEWLNSNFISFVIKQGKLTKVDKEVLSIVADQYPSAISSIYFEALGKENYSFLEDYIESKYAYLNPKYQNVDSELINTQKLDLFRIIHSKANPFKQENALLRLALSLINELEKNDDVLNLDLINIKVASNNWADICNPMKSDLSIYFSKSNIHFDYPIFVKGHLEKKLYFLGAILRSSMTGFNDYTAHTFLNRSELSVYKGLKSSSFVRKFSLINKGIGFNSNEYPVTPWMAELLFKLLQWPGVELKDIKIRFKGNKPSLAELRKILTERIEYQGKIYGVSSNTPMYVIPSNKKSEDTDKKIKVVTVQSLLPQTKDFDDKNPLSWSDDFRRRHRRHLADLTKLIAEKIEATKIVNNIGEKYDIDLIVFPELSVHSDDLEYLRRLSDKTNAHIFAGLTFISAQDSEEVSNQALWLIRDETPTGRDFRYFYQGKQNMTTFEKKMNISSKRPYQLLIEIPKGDTSYLVSGSICYDATDMRITSDLRDLSDVYLITAYNKDVNTFDKMAAYLNYHMYQPIVLVNTGNYGGSTVQAPFLESYKRTLTHVHGGEQIAISLFEIDPSPFKALNTAKVIKNIELKSPPATYNGRSIQTE
ncbi:hypothetical protein LG275_07835 [Chryseomicrobium palamuruense]